MWVSSGRAFQLEGTEQDVHMLEGQEGNNVAEWAKGKDPEQDRGVARARSGTLWLLFEWDEAALRLWWQEGMNWPSYSLYPSSCQYLLMSLSTFLYSPIISPKLYFLAPATLNSRLLPNSPLLLTPDFLWLLAPTTINSYHQSASTYFLLTWVSWHPNSRHQNSWLSPLHNFWHHQSYFFSILHSTSWSLLPHGSCSLLSLLSLSFCHPTTGVLSCIQSTPV